LEEAGGVKHDGFHVECFFGEAAFGLGLSGEVDEGLAGIGAYAKNMLRAPRRTDNRVYIARYTI
jgi:hypothetical protein